MKYEPLKNKLKGFDAFTTYTGTTVAFYGFREEDVKSAVEGLLADIDVELKRTKKDMVQYLIDNDSDNRAFSSGYRIALENIKDKIKKWFPDVFKEADK